MQSNLDRDKGGYTADGYKDTLTVDDTLIVNCVNYGNVTSRHYAAGIAITSNRTVNCGNEGNVTIVTEAGGDVGASGILRSLMGGLQGGIPVIIESCYNTGDITITSSGNVYAADADGISSARDSMISNSYNTGDISILASSVTTNGEPRVAGINHPSHVNNSSYTPYIKNSYNTGTTKLIKKDGSYTVETPGKVNDGTFGLYELENNYAGAVPGTFTAADLGPAFVEDGGNINGGFPVLKWQVAVPYYAVDFTGLPTGGTLTVKTAGGAARSAGAGGVYLLSPGGYSYAATDVEGKAIAAGAFNVVSGPKTVALTATVTFTELPDGATLTVRNSLGALQTGADGIYELPNGSYTYSATDGTETVGGTFTVAGAGLTIALPPLAPRSPVTFGVTPSGATVTVRDSKEKIVSPASGTAYSLYIGQSYTYTASAYGYVSQSGEITVENDPRTVAVTLERQYVTVTFTPSPTGATVVVEDAKGTILTPVGGRSYSLIVGEQYTYTVSAEKYDTKRQSFTASELLTTINVPLDIARGEYPPGWDKWRPSFGVYILNADGTTGTRIGNWLYDLDAKTYGGYDADGVFAEAEFIEDRSNNPIVYSGMDMMPASRLGVVKKYIKADSVIDYYNGNNGDYPDVTPDNYRLFDVKTQTNSVAAEDPYLSNSPNMKGGNWDSPGGTNGLWAWIGVFDTFSRTTRYYYPDFLKGTNSWMTDKTGYKSQPLTNGTPVPTVLAITGYDERINRMPTSITGSDEQIGDDAELRAAIDYLTEKTDNERALRNFEGMRADIFDLTLGEPESRPLGGDSSYYVGAVWIAPTYRTLTVGMSSNDAAVGFANVQQVGGVYRAAAGQTVRFTVTSPEKPITGVSAGGSTLTADAGGVYSFTMPNADAGIFVNLLEEHDIRVVKDGGAATAALSARKARMGDTVTFTVVPGTGFELADVRLGQEALAADAGGVYSFTMPDAPATITLTLNVRGDVPKHSVKVSEDVTGGLITANTQEAFAGEAERLRLKDEQDVVGMVKEVRRARQGK
jgi:hypothetical protein